jgi:alpha-tubulin suppressor-like RCC1 family protein
MIKFELDTRLPLQVGVDPNSVKIGEIILDASRQAPYTAYVPVTVTGEGMFDFTGSITIEAPDGELFENGLSTWTEPVYSLGVFAFEGEAFFSADSESALKNKAHRNLTDSPEFIELSNKQMKIKSLFGEEDDRVYMLRKQEINRLYKLYYNKYRAKSLSFRAMASPVSFAKGETVTLSVNFPTNSGYTSFLPLDGAEITVIDNNNSAVIASGTLNKGKFAFISPRDGLSFTAKVTAKYGSNFVIRDGILTEKPIIEVGFTDTPVFNIKTTEKEGDDLLTIKPYEANAWSVFQALTELQSLTNTSLGVSKNKGYSVFVNEDINASNYRPASGELHISRTRYFSWDVIAHEFSHAISNETGSTLSSVGGNHTGANQYDNKNNSATYQNKDSSLILAFNEGFATWLGVSLLENSAYKGKMPDVGDGKYLNWALEPNTPITYFGEDTEYAIANLLWDIVDSSNEGNSRALCKNGCKDDITIPLGSAFANTLKGKSVRNISEYYGNLYSYYVGSAIDSIGKIDEAVLTKAHQLGAIFGEFGIAPTINEELTNFRFEAVYQTGLKAPTLTWRQLKTGEIPGLDTFEILFFNALKNELIHKLVIADKLYPETDGAYSYTFSDEDVKALKSKFTSLYSREISVMIKGTASGEKAEKGKIKTGAYYSNLATFDIGARFTVVAVDSSGSNTSTDPMNLRIGAAHGLLERFENINKNILEGSKPTTEKPYLVSALDFDSYVRELSSFASPTELRNRQIFNAIDSSGGTDVAAAINYAVSAINSVSFDFILPWFNKSVIYIFSDMDNNSGMNPVNMAIARAKQSGIAINYGHLQTPLVLFSATSAAKEINGDPIAQTSSIAPMSVKTSFDSFIEAILETGGTYAVIQDAESQAAWVELMAYFMTHDIETVEEIPLPFNIKFYGLAKSDRDTPAFLITPKDSGVVTITFDSKGNFTPNLKIDGGGEQEVIGSSGDYRIKFNVRAGRTYRVTVNKPEGDSGLYNIVANIEVKAVRNTLFKGSLITTGATIDENGDAYVWGFRGSAQQGNGKLSVSSSSAPAKVETLKNITELTGGAYHLIALDEEGNVWGWGQSGYGETGCKPTTGIYVQTPCLVLSDVTQIATGEYFTIALDTEGGVWTWGHNLYGQLGDGGSKNSQTPIQVNLKGEKARLIGGAYEGAFAVTNEGHVWAWGDNEASGLGFQGSNYGVQKIVRVPTRITNLDQYASDIIYIGGGNGWGEALLQDGTVIGWGLSTALGQGTTATNLSSPDPVVILRDIRQLHARYVGSIALGEDGSVYTWGQTGGSAFKAIYGEYPTLRNAQGKVVEIGGGKEHIFYKTQEGDLYGVGYNDLYKLDLNKLGSTIDWSGSKIEYK